MNQLITTILFAMILRSVYTEGRFLSIQRQLAVGDSLRLGDDTEYIGAGGM